MLFTIGHSNHSLDAFLALLAAHSIAAIADVRSQPHSRWLPHFNRERLAESLAKAGIRYFFLGEALGARRVEESCYIGDRADYERIASLPVFRHGLDQVRQLVADSRVALMCAEKEPLDCHRTILVCRHLREELPIGHILADGMREDHAATEARLLKKMKIQRGLFDEAADALQSAYDQRGLQIAYSRAK